MALQNLLGDLNLETTQQQIATLTANIQALTELVEYLAHENAHRAPRVSASRQMLVAIDSSVALTAASTTVTTTNYVNATSNPVTSQTIYRTMEPYNFSSTAAQALYSNIVVS